MDELTFSNRPTDREESESTHNMKNQLHFSSGNVDSSARAYQQEMARLDQQEMAGLCNAAMLCNAQLLENPPAHARAVRRMQDTEQQLPNHNNTYPWESTVSPSVTFHRLTSNDV